MRILICTVADSLAASAAENRNRLASREKLLDAAANESSGVDLVVLPGGCFATQGDPTKAPMLQKIWAAIEKRRIAVCFGIDTAEKIPGDDELAVKNDRLASYGFACTPKDGCVGPWRQRSKTSRDQKVMKAVWAVEKRHIHVSAQRVALLMYGEVFNPQLRAAVQAQGIKVVVDMIHTGYQCRFAGAARKWSSAKPINAVFMFCHAARVGARKRWSIAGKYPSSSKSPIIVDAPVRIEGLVVSIP